MSPIKILGQSVESVEDFAWSKSNHFQELGRRVYAVLAESFGKHQKEESTG